jgi:hypothetical protein
MRDGIGRVDALLRAFSQLATPPVHSAADLGQAVSRALLLFGFEARRGNVQLTRHGPSELPVEGDGALVDELVCHAVLAGIVLAQDGTLELSIVPEGTRARLDLRGEGLAARRVDALPHLEEVRRLTSELQIERSIDADSAPVARLSLMFAQSR